MSYYFYFARCSDDSLYAGYCKDVQAREEKHNKGQGAKYTRSRSPIKIIYTETFDTQREAMQREIEVKKWNRLKKEKLIKNVYGTER
jgi:putative endonuclease